MALFSLRCVKEVGNRRHYGTTNDLVMTGSSSSPLCFFYQLSHQLFCSICWAFIPLSSHSADGQTLTGTQPPLIRRQPCCWCDTRSCQQQVLWVTTSKVQLLGLIWDNKPIKFVRGFQELWIITLGHPQAQEWMFYGRGERGTPNETAYLSTSVSLLLIR